MRRLLLLSVLVLAACKPAAPADDAMMDASSSSVAVTSSVMQKSSAAAMMDDTRMADDDATDDDAMAYGGTYVTGITEAQLQDGSTKVLFFHAGWCPYCKAHDEALQGWYAADNAKLSTYKIDYDSSLELRSRYGVIQQDTFVLVDGDGNKLQELTGYPSNAAIQAMIGSN